MIRLSLGRANPKLPFPNRVRDQHLLQQIECPDVLAEQV
jgi:hypothetical protein